MYIDKLVGKHGARLEDVLPLIEPYEGMDEITLPNTAQFRFVEDKQSSTGSQLMLAVPGSMQDYRVDYNGYNKAMRLAGFSESIITKYPVGMMIEPLNWGWSNKVGETVKAFVRNEHLVAFVKPSLELVSTEALLRTAFKVLGPDKALVERLDHNMSYTNISMITGEVTREWADERLARKGQGNDAVVGGISFTNSLMGESPLEVNGYVYRLVCANGMVSAESRFKWSRKNEITPLTEWFEEHVVACRDLLSHEFDKIDQMIRTVVPEGHKHQVLTNVFAEYELSERLRHLVLERLTDEPPRNMWDIVNALTNVANATEYAENPHTIRRLQSIGGEMVTKTHICELCHSVTKE